MSRATRDIVLVLIFTFYQVNATKDPVNLLLNLVARNEQKPMVAYVSPGKVNANFIRVSVAEAEKKYLGDLLLTNEGLLDDDDDIETTAKEQAKHLLYKFLRTSPDEDTQLEDTKKILRQALRSRCKKVAMCVFMCAITEPKCPKKCQKKHDDMDLCEPPKNKCNKKRCGKTMPPKWLL